MDEEIDNQFELFHEAIRNKPARHREDKFIRRADSPHFFIHPVISFAFADCLPYP